MGKGKVFGVLGLLLSLWLLVTLPAPIHAQQGSNTQPNFVFINYIGQEVVLDLDDVTYRVPGTATSPGGGRFELTLAPGEHKYAANVPGVDTGSAGTFIITPGGYVGKAARLEKTNALLDREGNVLEKPKDYVFIFDVDPFVSAITATPTAVSDTWKPAPAAPGQGSLAWTNYTGEELTIDLNGTLYKVPPAANNIAGHSQINVAPGLYRYTASVPNGSVNGEVNLVAGQVMGLTISAKLQEEPRYDIGEPAPQVPPVELQLTQQDVTAQAVVTTPAPAAAVVPASAPAANPVQMPAPAAANGLLIKNYTGDTLIFTINNQAYSILNNEQITLSLSPGSYNYTASLPFVATTGTVNVAAGQGIELSVAINLNHDVLSIYQN